MTCAELDNLLCDYADGHLSKEEKAAVDLHLAGCAACAEFARDVLGAVQFIERAAVVDVPQELMTRILFEVQSGKNKTLRAQSGWRVWRDKWFEPILQPRFAMGMAMTILSFAMLGRFAGIEVRQLKPSDLDPVKVWTAVDNNVHRTWDRAVKYYDSLRFVYEIQSRIKEWNAQAEDEKPAAPQGSGAGVSGSGPAEKGSGK